MSIPRNIKIQANCKKTKKNKNKQPNRQTGKRQASKQRDRQTSRQSETDRQTDRRWRDRQTDRQADRQADRSKQSNAKLSKTVQIIFSCIVAFKGNCLFWNFLFSRVIKRARKHQRIHDK